MKKLLSVLLILAMALSLGVTAFADETGEENKPLIEKLASGELQRMRAAKMERLMKGGGKHG